MLVEVPVLRRSGCQPLDRGAPQQCRLGDNVDFHKVPANVPGSIT